MLISRIAPTPSGYLHLGNAVNFLLTQRMVRAHGGKLILRIDDMDAVRMRPEYLADVFWALDWLGISPDAGPRTPEDFLAHFRADPTRLRAELAAADLPTYVCRCSRRELAARPRGKADPCLGADLSYEVGRTAIRIHVPRETCVPIPGSFGKVLDLQAELGDFVLWRRDDQPSYQLASVVADRDLGVNLVVRGEDLLASTAAQLYLAPALGADSFRRARFVHHPLVTDAAGQKLSKSAGSYSLRQLARLPDGLTRVHAAVDRLAASLDG